MTQPAPRPLFRAQALRTRRDIIWTGHAIRPPVSFAVIATALALAALAIAAFVGTQSYARKAMAGGYLAPPHGVVRVIAPRAGTIVSVAVGDGDLVRAGDPLMRVSAGRTSVAGSDLDANVRRALVQQRDLELDQIALEEANARSEAQRLHERIERLADETGLLAQQLAAQEDRTDLATEEAVVSRELVSKGFVARVEQRRREDTRLSQTQALSAMRQQLSAKLGELVELRYALEQLPRRSATQIATRRAAAAGIDSRLAEAEAQRAYLVTAPVAGRVSGLQAFAGNQADPSRPLLSIVPEDADLQAVLFVPERAIGFVAAGQPVRLSLDAFPPERFGTVPGTIAVIASTPLRPEQVSGVVQLPGEPTYRVTVTLSAHAISAYGRDMPLRADMQVHADIIFDRRGLVRWLLDPVLSARARS